jgi:hypothetical protein
VTSEKAVLAVFRLQQTDDQRGMLMVLPSFARLLGTAVVAAILASQNLTPAYGQAPAATVAQANGGTVA